MGQDLDYSKEKVLTKTQTFPRATHPLPKIAKPFYHRVDPDDEKYCSGVYSTEGYGGMSAVGKELGLKRKYLPN